MKFVIRGKNGFAFTSTEIGKVGTEVQYDSYEKAERALEELHQTMPFLKFDIVALAPAGRPSLGTTKKVSLTLPDEIWEMIAERKKVWGVSQSQTLRMMVEEFFFEGTGLHDNDQEEAILVQKDLVNEIRELSKGTDEIYENQDTEDLVHNILNAELLRLKGRI